MANRPLFRYGARMSEFDWIDRFIKPVSSGSIVLGKGDDCSLVDHNENSYLIQTSDILIEDVHFRRSHLSFADLAVKALSVNISDIAAMGGKPRHAHLTLGLPKGIKESDVETFFNSFYKLAEKHNISLIGGDLSRSPQSIVVDIHLSGIVDKKKCKLRKNLNRPGSILCVSGPLGSSAAGFHCLEKGLTDFPSLIEAHRVPPVELAIAQFLADQKDVYGMMDLSDGLLSDLKRIEGLSVDVEIENIPVEPEVTELAKKCQLDPHRWVLAGGEDYRLLFNCDAKSFSKLQSECEQVLGRKIFSIGKVSEDSTGIRFFQQGLEFQADFPIFSHF